MPGSTAAPLDQLLDTSACWATYHRTCTKLPHRSFSLPFLPSRWPGRRRVSPHAAIHTSAVPAQIGDRSGDLAPGAHTALTQPPSLGVPKATLTPWCVCVCMCECMCVCVLFPSLTISILPALSLYCQYSDSNVSLDIRQLSSLTMYDSLTSSYPVFPVCIPIV